MRIDPNNHMQPLKPGFFFFFFDIFGLDLSSLFMKNFIYFHSRGMEARFVRIHLVLSKTFDGLILEALSKDVLCEFVNYNTLRANLQVRGL